MNRLSVATLSTICNRCWTRCGRYTFRVETELFQQHRSLVNVTSARNQRLMTSECHVTSRFRRGVTSWSASRTWAMESRRTFPSFCASSSPSLSSYFQLELTRSAILTRSYSIKATSAVASEPLRKLPPAPMVVSRIMAPDDTMTFGSVMGGVLLELMEEAGTISASEYCNTRQKRENVAIVSACVEKADFLSPMYLGEVAEVHARLGFASLHSLQYIIEIYARNVMRADRRLACTSKIWYVPLTPNEPHIVQPVPAWYINNTSSDPSSSSSPSSNSITAGVDVGAVQTLVDSRLLESGLESYKSLRQQRENIASLRIEADRCTPRETVIPDESAKGTPRYSDVSSIRPVEPFNCWAGAKYCRGGTVLKWMDEAGALAAAMHTQSTCYAASVDKAFLVKQFGLTNAAEMHARPVFASDRTLDVHVAVTRYLVDHGKRIVYTRAAEATFTYVILKDKLHNIKSVPSQTTTHAQQRVRDIPPLKPETDAEKAIFEARRKIYEQRKVRNQTSLQ